MVNDVPRMPLVVGDLMLRLALRRVNQGGVAWLEGRYYDYGRPLLAYMNAPLNACVGAAHVALGETDLNAAGMRRAVLTHSGRELYGALDQRHG